MDGLMVSSMFDNMTSVGSAMALAKKTYAKPSIRYKCNLVFGVQHPRVLTNMYAKLRDIFDGCSSVNERQLTCVLVKSDRIEKSQSSSTKKMKPWWRHMR